MGTIETEKILELLKNVYEKQMPFNQLLNIKILSLTHDNAVVGIDMRDELVGNFKKKILHGGVIASVLDFTGGVIAQLHVIKEMENSSPEELVQRLVQMGTIDMRVDYIRPGYGDSFKATGNILRLGNKVAVIRTQFHSNLDKLIAAGTCTYIVG